jgi:hypothetical protein
LVPFTGRSLLLVLMYLTFVRSHWPYVSIVTWSTIADKSSFMRGISVTRHHSRTEDRRILGAKEAASQKHCNFSVCKDIEVSQQSRQPAADSPVVGRRGTTMEGAGLTRQSSRERVQTPKAVEWNKRRSRAMSSDAEDTIEVIETAPAAPQSKRPEISSHFKERIVATKVKALAAKAGERPATTAAAPNQGGHEKTISATAQLKMLTQLVTSLLKAMEEQKQEHADQMETLTETFTRQINTLKAEVAEMTEKIQIQLSDIQAASPSLSYAEVARIPPNSLPSNVRTLLSMGTTPSTMTDTLYCTIDTSRVGEEERNKA